MASNPIRVCRHYDRQSFSKTLMQVAGAVVTAGLTVPPAPTGSNPLAIKQAEEHAAGQAAVAAAEERLAAQSTESSAQPAAHVEAEAAPEHEGTEGEEEHTSRRGTHRRR